MTYSLQMTFVGIPLSLRRSRSAATLSRSAYGIRRAVKKRSFAPSARCRWKRPRSSPNTAACHRGVAGQRPRVVGERFLENKVYAAQSAAGHKAPLRPAGGLGGAVSPPPPQAGFGAWPQNILKILKI